MSYDQMSLDSDGSCKNVQCGQNGFDQSCDSKKVEYEENSISPPSRAASASQAPVKGIEAQLPVEPRLCGLIKPSRRTNDIIPLSTSKEIYVQRITPEHKKGADRWGEGGLKLPPPIKVAELWSQKTTVLLCLRRPGCVVSRAEAHQLYARKPKFDARGVQLVAALNEYIDPEVKVL
jgi:hypothetical protein